MWDSHQGIIQSEQDLLKYNSVLRSYANRPYLARQAPFQMELQGKPYSIQVIREDVKDMMAFTNRKNGLIEMRRWDPYPTPKS